MHSPASLPGVAVALLAALPSAYAGLYPKSSPVLQVTGKTYDQLIAKSNHTSIVEFFAPWCGHCQNLKPAYEKAARSLEGLAKVAAVDCDDDANKPFCGRMGVQGFPTLKIVRPGKKSGRPVVEDYQGARTASGIVDAVLGSINNHVKKVTDKDADAFLESEGPKALLFTDKGTTSPMLKSIAIDFLGVITVGQVRNKEEKTVEKFGVTKFPTLVLLPGGGQDAVVYDGELKKAPIVAFLSQAGAPNPDAAPPAASAKPAKKDTKKETKKDKEPKKEPKKPKEEEPSSSDADSESETTSSPTEQQTAPVIVESALPIPTIHAADKLNKECLHEKAHTCVLALVPEHPEKNGKAQRALDALAELAHKHAQSKRHLFPFYAVPVSDANPAAAALLKALDLSGGDDVQLIAINARRGWWRHYEGGEPTHEGIESWIDAIRMSEGVKKKLPEGLVAIAVEDGSSSSEAKEETKTKEPAPASSAAEEEASTASEAAPEEETAKAEKPGREKEEDIKHEEL